MIAEDELRKFVELYRHECLNLPRTVFTPDVMASIAREFSFSSDEVDAAGQILEAGAQQWAIETERAKLDFEAIRKELRSLERAAKVAGDILGRLSGVTTGILIESSAGRGLSKLVVPAITLDGSAPALTYADPLNDKNRCVSLKEIEAILVALSRCAVDAGPTAGSNKKGRPADEALFDLLHFGFHAWKSVLGREFTLDWASDAEPITLAARFCVRIARVVNPTAPAQKIVTAARKVQEKSLSFSNLEDIPKVEAHYRKWIE
jgi:hypothetical protein